MTVYYASRTGNVEAMIGKLGIAATKIESGSEVAESDFVLIDVESYRRLPFPGHPASPFNRNARALALAPLLPCVASSDIPLFAGSFALPGESPDAWSGIFLWLHRRPKLRPLSKPALLFRSLAPFRNS